jgi:hypothetical protein
LRSHLIGEQQKGDWLGFYPDIVESLELDFSHRIELANSCLSKNDFEAIIKLGIS